MQTVTRSFPGKPLLGSAFVFCGAVLACVVFVDRTTGLPSFVPRFWYINRPFWLVLAITLVILGATLLKTRIQLGDAWMPQRPGVRFQTLVLYARADCHLCDQTKEMLVKYSAYLPTLEEIDIDSDPELKQNFDTCVPVVAIDGKIRFRGSVDERLLRRLIEGTRPRER